MSFAHTFSKRSHSNPNGIPPQSPGLGGTTYPGNNVQKAFSTPKVLRPSSAIWAQPRWGCFAQGHKTQGRPAAVAVGQPWAGGRNPVGIKGNETTLRIAYSWAKHSPRQRVRDGWTLIGTGAIQGIATRPARFPISRTHSTRARHPRAAPSASGRACGPRLRIAPPGSGSGSSKPRDARGPS